MMRHLGRATERIRYLLSESVSREQFLFGVGVGSLSLGFVVVFAPWAIPESVVRPLVGWVAAPLPITLIAGVGEILIGFIVLQVVAVSFVQPWVTLNFASGFALGGATLFVAALIAAELGATPVVVFCGVAAALVVQDVGDHAAEINLQIGRDAETRRGEIVHATGTLLVAGAGVGMAVAALSFVGLVSLPTDT